MARGMVRKLGKQVMRNEHRREERAVGSQEGSLLGIKEEEDASRTR